MIMAQRCLFPVALGISMAVSALTAACSASTRVQAQPTGPTYVRRQPEKTALYRVMQEHLLTFEQQWTDEASGRTLPKFVTDEPRFQPAERHAGRGERQGRPRAAVPVRLASATGQ
jgi:hypothetical protein